MMMQKTIPIQSRRTPGPDLHLFSLRDAELARLARPGQFVNVRVSGATAPLLRRPFSICDANPQSGEILLLIKVVGEGTEALARAGAGDAIDLVGPLGAGFSWQGETKALLVGGGVGIAPLHFLAAEIARARARGEAVPDVAFAYGARDSRGLALIEEIERLADRLIVATEDGSRGHKGFVTEAIGGELRADTPLYCCGPTPMMAATLKAMRARGIERGWFSLENQMGCGVGVCQGCVVRTRRGYARVCVDGPVLSAEDLDFSLMASASAPS